MQQLTNQPPEAIPGICSDWPSLLYQLLCNQNIESLAHKDTCGCVELKRCHLPGIYLSKWKSYFKSNQEIRQTTTENYFFTLFMLKGKVSYSFPFAHGRLISGENNIMGLPAGSQGSLQFAPKEECVFWSALLQPAFMEQLLQRHPFPLAHMRKLFDKGQACCLSQRNLINCSETILIMKQIEEALNTQKINRLFVEAKVMELISLQLQAYCYPRNCKKQPSERDCEKIRQVADQLTDLKQTPHIDALARQIGFNVNKLQLGFQALYGTTVKRYQNQLRMIKARELIHNKDLSIADIAWECGFTCQSHFSTAFKDSCGLSPREYRKGLLKDV